MALGEPPVPSDQVTLQVSTDRSTVPPLPGEGSTCFLRSSDQQQLSIPFHHLLATWSPGWTAEEFCPFLPSLLKDPPPSLLHLVKRRDGGIKARLMLASKVCTQAYVKFLWNQKISQINTLR